MNRPEIIVGRKYLHVKTGKAVKLLSHTWSKIRLEHASGRITEKHTGYFMSEYNLAPIDSTDIERDGMLNKGLHQNRFQSNPLEEAYATAWNLKNTPGPGTPLGHLDYLLARDNNCPAGEVTDRDREVAATVIEVFKGKE